MGKAHFAKNNNSPPPPPLSMSLIIKSGSNADLLNTTTGGFSKDQIQLFTINPDNSKKPVTFRIAPPFDNGIVKLNYYQLVSTEITQSGEFFLQLGENKVYKLKLWIDLSKHKINKVTANETELPAESSLPDGFPVYVLQSP